VADSNRVRIFDTTLRDGEQSPGATMTSGEKLKVAEALSKLGVDVIEAGFAAASPDDLRAIRTIAETIGTRVPEKRASGEPPTICSLARATKNDIDKAWESVKPAHYPRIHTFLATSPIHREHKLKMSRAEVVAKAREMVSYARGLCADVEFSPEDAGRTEMDFLYEVLAAVIEAGATTLNIPDTVGYMTPDEFGARIAGIRANVPGIEKAIISVHCHNDLGLATANSLAGIHNGARQVEVAVNGIGERAGNTALEEIVMALHTRRAFYEIDTHVDTTQLTKVSKLVSAVTGMNVQPNKAIVGANAFAHEAGIHQDGMLKNKETYEIMNPETVGAARTELVLGKHSGRHAFQVRLGELGYPLEGKDLERAFDRFKQLADRKKIITDADLLALVSDEIHQPKEYFRLEALQVGCGTMGMPTATVRVAAPGGKVVTEVAVGTGPVDAVYKAVDNVAGLAVTLLEYTVHSVTAGIDALGEVSVRVRANDPDGKDHPQEEGARARVFHGHGADTDIVVASAKAYIAALNRMMAVSEATASVRPPPMLVAVPGKEASR
jgi:2-isopropylmalate synthase